MKTRTRFNAWIRRALGVAAIVGVIVVMTGWGSGLLTTFCVVKTAKAASQPFLSEEGRLPDLDGAFIDERRKVFQTHWDRRPHLLIRVSVTPGCTTRRSATRKTVHLRRGRRNSVARNPRRNEYRNLAECCQLWSSASEEQRCKGIP